MGNEDRVIRWQIQDLPGLVDQLSPAVWAAIRADKVSWVDDEHGHIAAIVPTGLVDYALRHGWGK
jgi:hypothetical protein